MFTGIVEEMGTVVTQGGAAIRIQAHHVLRDTKIGDSLSVDGCCLTVARRGDDWWEADVSDETRRRTAINDVRPGDFMNLERAVRAGDPLGGHFVQGHVDGVGEIVSPAPDLQVRIQDNLLMYLSLIHI